MGSIQILPFKPTSQNTTRQILLKIIFAHIIFSWKPSVALPIILKTVSETYNPEIKFPQIQAQLLFF